MLYSLLLGFLALFLLHIQPALAQVQYCSSQNTADGDAIDHTYQSNGWCADQCREGYAFGIVQGRNCWCSNYIPEDQTDTSDCNKDCPGYPDEKCGNENEGLFGYVRLDRKPSGTQGGSRPTSAPPSPPPVETEPDRETVVETVTQESTVVLTSIAESEASKTDSSVTAAPTSAEPTTTKVEVSTLTDAGGRVSVITITYVPTAPAAPESNKGTNAGAIAGGVIGGLVALAAIVGGVVFFLRRRRRQQQPLGEEDGGVGRHTNAGLIRSEKNTRYPPPIATTNTRRSSRLMETESGSPVSGSERRHSRPYIFDQRLNPSAIMIHDNDSRGSVVSLDDGRDYGRTLNVRNPDPDPDR
ncbi:hypothetical protein M011DRAFT_455299 [Sporormia fimetaria CBS 119925]|uniref:WSC domain-containing protein n=1 Tax=Sporormia fimetaria CBS 119925 TaxID=1340428 RepID=A0A6A6VNW6_9PLEO|nr:hypothetical protein M011DRAFT_455299 [Sporormia fimetaria CBS 119925]